MSELKTDILIIGGGIAGCIAAISLVDRYNVTLVDKLVVPKERIGESLAPAAQRILRELNLWNEFQSQEGHFYKNNLGMQSYWGSDKVHLVDYLRNPDGFVKSLDRKLFENYLRLSAENRGVNCFWGGQLQSATYKQSFWETTVKCVDIDRMTISSSFVIDASGRQAHFARSLGIKRDVEDRLISCWMTLPNIHQNTMSTIAACENGWWYSAVVPNGKRILAFHTDADLIEKQDFKKKASLLKLARKNRAIKGLLDVDDEVVELKGVTAANSTKLGYVSGNQWAAIGDAAVSFDPLSSQGMFNAMATAMQLAQLIKQYGFGQGIRTSYQSQINTIWEHYKKHKHLFYQMERRWKSSEFWKRRLL